MAREARHFVDEAFPDIFDKYLAEISKQLLNFVRQVNRIIRMRKVVGLGCGTVV